MAPERQRLARLLLDEYIEMYASRDARLVNRFSQNFSGFAGSSDQLVKTREAWVGMVLSDFAQVPGRIGIHMVDVFPQDLADDVLAVTAFFHIELPTPNPLFAQETARLVLVFRNEGADWKIAHSSISMPYDLPRGRGGITAVPTHQDPRDLQSLLDERTLALSDALHRLEVLSHTDRLTGIANRSRFEEVLAREWHRAQRSQTPLALVMADVDAFRQFNDDYGRLAGDACLQALALVLTQTGVRDEKDMVARHGSDEFVVLMPGAEAQTALNAVHGIQQAIAALDLRQQGTPSGALTASFGVAALVPQRDQGSEELVRCADLGLRRAKRSGCNSIGMAPG